MYSQLSLVRLACPFATKSCTRQLPNYSATWHRAQAGYIYIWGRMQSTPLASRSDKAVHVTLIR